MSPTRFRHWLNADSRLQLVHSPFGGRTRFLSHARGPADSTWCRFKPLYRTGSKLGRRWSSPGRGIWPTGSGWVAWQKMGWVIKKSILLGVMKLELTKPPLLKPLLISCRYFYCFFSFFLSFKLWVSAFKLILFVYMLFWNCYETSSIFLLLLLFFKKKKNKTNSSISRFWSM